MTERTDILPMWVVYDHPTDCPDSYVARLWEIGPGGTYRPTLAALRAPTLSVLRRHFQRSGLTCLARNASDDPCIVETWL